jgi:hypothetical protein
MPVVAADLEIKLYEAISEAVRAGNYRNLQQFLEVAAWNQLALEDSAAGDSSVRGDEGRKQGGGGASPLATSETAPGESAADSWRPMLRSVSLTERDELPTPKRIDDLTVALWGQTNRVLPIAVGVRVLAHLMKEAGGDVLVSAWHEAATRVATDLRQRLRDWDTTAGRRHGSLWATAFPGDNPASAHRYVNQFLGAPRKDGLSDGGAAFLGFVDFEEVDGYTVRLTRSGADWAKLANPIFDGDGDPARTFSPDEAVFFIDHLHTYRPGEHLLLNRIAAIVADERSRTEIDEELTREYPQWAKYISTMRAGALGRLSDLGLLERTRRGLEVDYHLTDLAAEVGLPNDRLELVS